VKVKTSLWRVHAPVLCREQQKTRAAWVSSPHGLRRRPLRGCASAAPSFRQLSAYITKKRALTALLAMRARLDALLREHGEAFQLRALPYVERSAEPHCIRLHQRQRPKQGPHVAPQARREAWLTFSGLGTFKA